ncbi:prolyl oligopeptidase family serine peptidase [Amycolatopsis sp. NPDC051371]|uniref:alpha/beta hydrolase n=1 Tax=Amycolatopsis sp. NPDC051371 TaxID=3155800 RepID=UPI00341E52DC
MFEGYASTSRSGFRAEVESEQALLRGEHLTDIATSYRHDLAGPAAEEARRRLDILTANPDFPGLVLADPVRTRRFLARHLPRHLRDLRVHRSHSAVAAADPVTHIKAGAPPFVLFHGNADTLISPSQTLELHNALRAAGVTSTRYVVDGGGHGDLAFTGDAKAAALWTTPTVADPLIAFLNQSLKK